MTDKNTLSGKTPISRRGFASLLGLSAVLIASPSLAAPASIRGTVSYRERMALPPSATVTVQLIDVSRAGASFSIIAETTPLPGRNVPIPYVIRYNDRDIRPNRRYALRAEIRDGRRLLFTTTQNHPILNNRRETTDLMLERAGASPRPEPDREPSLVGSWVVVDIAGQRVTDRKPPVLQIGPDNRVSGNTGCNGFGAELRVNRREIDFSRAISTQMACEPPIMRQERAFLSALEQARGYDLSPRSNQLELRDRRGRPLMRLRRA